MMGNYLIRKEKSKDTIRLQFLSNLIYSLSSVSEATEVGWFWLLSSFQIEPELTIPVPLNLPLFTLKFISSHSSH